MNTDTPNPRSDVTLSDINPANDPKPKVGFDAKIWVEEPEPDKFDDSYIANLGTVTGDVDGPEPQLEPTLVDQAEVLFERYKRWMASQPAWVHVIAVALTSAVSAMVTRYVPELAPFLPF